MTDAAATRAVEEAITSRHSIRAFLPTPVPRETIEAILAVAARAPSGTNTQPWHVSVLTGDALKSLSAKLVAAYDDPVERARHAEEYAYYPTEWRSPFIDRRRKVGWDLYGLLGIETKKEFMTPIGRPAICAVIGRPSARAACTALISRRQRSGSE